MYELLIRNNEGRGVVVKSKISYNVYFEGLVGRANLNLNHGRQSALSASGQNFNSYPFHCVFNEDSLWEIKGLLSGNFIMLADSRCLGILLLHQ
jgi:hypothetical protein